MKQLLLALLLTGAGAFARAAVNPPHIIFVMADDMGWGQTGYRGHPVLKTPNLDAMAANGLRFERFYAGGPVCSPTRATVLTGRTHERTGVPSHGHALRPQEKTIATALRNAGYVTGHFGKWHLNGLRGPGAPILAGDARHPGHFGFDEWVSTSNFYDVDPLLSRRGEFVDLRGDSSEVVVGEVVKFLERHRSGGRPMFAVIWYGTPHAPFRALPADKAPFSALDDASANHYGELVAMDRSVGTLRRRLRELGLAGNTLVVFCSDNGGLPGIKPDTVGGLRGHKGSVFEGGLRVPGIVEWPAVIKTPRVTSHPAGAADLFPTVADILGLPADALLPPVDGTSLKPLFTGEIGGRRKPLGFRYSGRSALVDNRYKLISDASGKGGVELFDLETDPNESKDLAATQPAVAERMRKELAAWNASVEASIAGRDYPEGKVTPADPKPQFWYDTEPYQKYLEQWGRRWEYQSSLKRASGGGAKKKGKKSRPAK